MVGERIGFGLGFGFGIRPGMGEGLADQGFESFSVSAQAADGQGGGVRGVGGDDRGWEGGRVSEGQEAGRLLVAQAEGEGELAVEFTSAVLVELGLHHAVAAGEGGTESAGGLGAVDGAPAELAEPVLAAEQVVGEAAIGVTTERVLALAQGQGGQQLVADQAVFC